MNARAALFDLFGDHLRRRDDAFADRAPVSALVRLLDALDIAGPAVRTAVSRMTRQGWLQPVRTPAGRGYALTERAVRRLDDTAVRVYRTTGLPAWNGTWHLLVLQPPISRPVRDRVAGGLAFAGYGQLEPAVWVSPRRAPDALEVLAAEGVQAETFLAHHDGDGAALVARAWDLDALAAAYDDFLTQVADIAQVDGEDPREAFAARSRLVHAWRKFLFLDPVLPRPLLPPEWAGDRAGAFFDREAGRLLAPATRFVDACLGCSPPVETLVQPHPVEVARV